MEPQTPAPNNQPVTPSNDAPPSEPAPINSTGFAGDPAELHVNVPEGNWPGAFGIFKHSKSAVKLNFWTLAAFWLLSLAVSVVLGSKHTPLVSIVTYIVDAFASTAFTITFIASVRGQRLDVGKAFNEAVPLFLKFLVLNILVLCSLTLSFVLLIVPFFFVLPRLSLANYFLVDKNMGILEAYKASWHATQGNAGKVWGIYGVSILFAVLMLVLVGIYLTIVYSAAIAVLYEYLNRQPAPRGAEAPAQQQQPTANPTPPTEPTPPTV